MNVDQWKTVRTGLGRIIAACFTMIGTWTVVLLIYGIGFFVGLSVLDPTAALMVWGAAFACLVLGLIAVFGLEIIGLSECRQAPQRNGCYNLATISYNLLIATILAAVISTLVSVLMMVFATTGAFGILIFAGAFSGLAALVLGLLAVGTFFCTVFFMRAVSQTVKSPGQAFNCLCLMIAIPIAFPLGCGGIGSIWFLPRLAANPLQAGPLAFAPLCCGLGGNLLPLAVGIWFIVTLFMVRGAISDYLEGNVDY